MKPTTRTLAAFNVAGIARRVSNARPEEFGQLWREFFAGGGANQIPGRASDDLYAVYLDYESDHNGPYTMIIGCEIPVGATLPGALVARTVPAATYAVFDASGPQPASVIAVWQQVWSAPLARTYSGDFDHYRGPEQVEVHVAVR
jgi:predicted transcriptional regulator YdeE